VSGVPVADGCRKNGSGAGSPAGTNPDSAIRVDPNYQLKKGETVASVIGRHITLTMDDF